MCDLRSDHSARFLQPASASAQQSRPSPLQRHYAKPALVFRQHAFGAVTTLDTGEVVVSGGIANALWNRQASVETFSGDVIDGMAVRSTVTARLLTQRALHTTTALPNQAVLTVGGINLSTDVASLSLVAANEVLYLPR